MTINANNQEMTPSTFARYILCKIIEDVDENFNSYASVMYEDFSKFNDVEKAKINEWKHKEVVKLYKFLGKDGFSNEENA